LKEERTKFKEESSQAVALKDKIEVLKEKYEELKMAQEGEEDIDKKVIDEEEFTLIKQLKELTKQHKVKISVLKSTKAHIQLLNPEQKNVGAQFRRILEVKVLDVFGRKDQD
jgi:peroxiredoxin family protein